MDCRDVLIPLLLKLLTPLAYKTLHSTETALVRIHNDIIQSIDNDQCVILIFLDMSAAFDTACHA
jgi:hypothetical protein